MELETPLRPRAVAEAVWEEAGLWLDQPLPQRWLRELIAEANTLYANNARFRQQLRAPGDSGRDLLWFLSRHWLAAMIRKRRPRLYARLPSSYSFGQPLPEKPAVPVTTARHRRPAARKQYAWAAAAHWHD